MQIIESSEALRALVNTVKQNGQIVGFVPTMGALHEGHLSLVEKAQEQCDIIIVSIFVNPTQFNNVNDLATYPRTLSEDVDQLGLTACQYVFAPSVEDIYPEPDTRQFEFGMLDKVMEGRFRPGHFNGVAQVVSRLFDIVNPDYAFFGEKDFQQLAVVRRMVLDLGLSIKVVGCPIVRESDGLAMSSRNRLLSPSMRKKASIIAGTLLESCKFVTSKPINEVVEIVKSTIEADGSLEVEYFEIVDGDTLQPVLNFEESSYIVGCIAVYADNVRLIDNVIYKKPLS